MSVLLTDLIRGAVSQYRVIFQKGETIAKEVNRFKGFYDVGKFLCWLLGTSVRKIHSFLRTDVPGCQHSSFRLIPTTIKLTEVS